MDKWIILLRLLFLIACAVGFPTSSNTCECGMCFINKTIYFKANKVHIKTILYL